MIVRKKLILGGVIFLFFLIWIGFLAVIPEICAEKARRSTENKDYTLSSPTEEELKEYPNLQLTQLTNYYHEELRCKIEARKWLYFPFKLFTN